MQPTKRRRLKNLTVKEVSLVGLGANQPARVALWKSADVGTSAKPASQEKFSMDEKDKAVAEAVAKATEQAELIKSLNEKLAATEAEKSAEAAKAASAIAERDVAKAAIAKAERETLIAKTTTEVKETFKALPGVDYAKFAVEVIDLRDKAPELAKSFEAVLKAANDVIAGSTLFETVGAVVKTDVVKTGEQEYERLVVKTMADNKLTRDQAVVKVLDTVEGRNAYSQIVDAQ